MLTGIHPLRDGAPRRGWIAEVRGIIGMRAAQLATRLGVTQSAVAQFERSEQEGTITLNTLRKAAAALDCRLVYAFVPESTFEELVRARAQLIAREMVGSVEHTMALEDQAASLEQQQELIGDVADDLVRRLPRELWDAPR